MSALLLDTDIGSDLDDALCLAAILGSPGLELLGVTTVYGDTVVRARIAARMCELAGAAVPVVPGLPGTRSGRGVWWAGFEGRNVTGPTSPLVRDEDAIDFLVRTVAERPHEVDLLAIGPLTNVAAAIDRDPGFLDGLRHLYVMGGRFNGPEPEHNLLCDVAAAVRVFDAGPRCTVTALEATTSVRFEPEDFAAVRAAGPLGAFLDRESAGFLELTGRDWSSPHDPMALLPLLHPERFGTARGRIRIVPDGAEAGRSILDPDPDPAGAAHVVDAWDAAWTRTTVRDLVLAGCERAG